MKKHYPTQRSTIVSKKLHQRLLVWLVLLTLSTSAYAQQLVKGTVTDDKNAPLPGATVRLKDSNKAVAAGGDGAYSIAVNTPADVLVFSAIGTVAKEVTVGNQTVINVALAGDAKQLSDVVVIGYGTSTRQDITGSVTTIKSEDFNQGVLTTPAQLLQGKVAGLNITKSGDPNQRPSVVLRGPSTIRTVNGGVTEPFYVIDGVPGASIDLLAPDDIASIEVLKDASSTAIYGARAANGVIIITTKKSKAGQTRLTYSAYGAVEKVSKQIDVLSGDELRKYLADNNVKPLANPTDDDGSNTDWQDLVQRTSYSMNHNLSFGAAANNTDYGASANYLKNNGILRRTSLERIIIRGYLNQRFFNNRLKLGLNFINSTTNQNDIPQTNVLAGMLFYLPTVSPFNPDGTYKENYTRTGSGPLNPLSLVDNNTYVTKDNKTLINGLVQVDILKGLKFTLSGSTQKTQNNFSSYLNSKSGLAVNLGGVARRNQYMTVNDVLESYFNYDRDLGKHSIKLLAGYSYQQDRTNDGFGITTQNFANDALSYNNLYLSNPASLSQVAFTNNPISTLRLISQYGRVQYQYGDRYLAQASIRRDGSSAFGVNNRYGYFPTVAVGWRLINEKFMQDLSAFTDLKLRAGYGVSGNSQGFDAFSALLIYGTPPGSSKYLNNGTIANVVNAVRNENPNLKWESTATTNIGVDFGLLNNRVSGSVDYYIKKTSDLINDALPVSSTQFQYTTYTANVGRMTNKGIEVALNVVPVQTGSFRWTSSLNFSHNKNNIDNLSSGQFTIPYIQTAQLGGKGQSGNYSQIVQPGSPLGTFLLWHYIGKNEAGVSTYQKADGSITATQPLTTDQRYAGSAQPTLIYGWNNSFSFKGFDLNFLVRGVTGNKILNATLASLNNPADSKFQNIPRFTLGESFNDINGYLISDRFLESGSYLRLDNATLGYTIKPKVQSVKAIRLYVTGNNIFLLTKYRGIDPEINIGGLTPGIDNNNFYPKTRTFILGLNASF
ncbi:SusC/RagA family TonB-linked outer membrane protein [Hymenobacter crusticola]|uniref:SusC/RagA family TonB-linked outer membrane protein n=1 Tax=Hymenobacter crusticola TaxID=1770526 RepID=A0A243WGG3_9BACT|nr:SusC/RagA family TonB-linked outer membrane protein [Hymenobacter crusticola]OUJ74833.1 SusC/RagA family TonB-linked outer membrane protein [Hymenobacter crusticola]